MAPRRSVLSKLPMVRPLNRIFPCCQSALCFPTMLNQGILAGLQPHPGQSLLKTVIVHHIPPFIQALPVVNRKTRYILASCLRRSGKIYLKNSQLSSTFYFGSVVLPFPLHLSPRFGDMGRVGRPAGPIANSSSQFTLPEATEVVVTRGEHRRHQSLKHSRQGAARACAAASAATTRQASINAAGGDQHVKG